MFLIVIFGTILRLICIDKPDGLWNDEYVSWAIASIPVSKAFLQAVFAQCHMPFYYLYLKFFIHFFGNSDFMLRLTSVPPVILAIVSMYFVGKEVKDENVGLIAAFLTSISAFLIYFSQEVRFYGLLFLFSSLALLFTLKLLKNQNKLNLTFFVIANFLIIFTHTIGFIFVFFNLVFVSLFLKNNENCRKNISVLWSAIAISTLFCSPLLFKILSTHAQSQWWGSFHFSKVGFLLTDYFSPILTNIVSAPDNFFYNFNLVFIIFAIVPSIIMITAILKALLTKNKELLGIFSVSIVFVLTLVISSLLGKIVFITKYSMEIYPTLLLLTAFGLEQIQKTLRIFFIILLCFLNLLYIVISPTAAPRIRRSEGHKIVTDLIKNANLKNGDFILLNYYPKDRFEKYMDFSKYNVLSINKGTYPEYIGVSTKEEFPNVNKNYLYQKLNEEIVKKLKPGQKVAIVFLNDVAIYSPENLHLLLRLKNEYNKAPFLFIVFSYLKNKEFQFGLNELRILRYEDKGSWSVVTFTKK